MTYYIALRKEDRYIIVPESFGVRSNARKYAERMRWKDFFVATEEQRAMIEADEALDVAAIAKADDTLKTPVETIQNVVGIPAVKQKTPAKEDVPHKRRWNKDK